MPLVWELEGTRYVATEIRSRPDTGAVMPRVRFLEDEYLERRCLRLLEEWCTIGDLRRCTHFRHRVQLACFVVTGAGEARTG